MCGPQFPSIFVSEEETADALVRLLGWTRDHKRPPGTIRNRKGPLGTIHPRGKMSRPHFLPLPSFGSQSLPSISNLSCIPGFFCFLSRDAPSWTIKWSQKYTSVCVSCVCICGIKRQKKLPGRKCVFRIGHVFVHVSWAEERSGRETTIQGTQLKNEHDQQK